MKIVVKKSTIIGCSTKMKHSVYSYKKKTLMKEGMSYSGKANTLLYAQLYRSYATLTKNRPN